MKLDAWMSEFYGQNWWRMDSNILEPKEKGIYECRISPTDFSSLNKLSEHGFELVETLIEFSTEVTPSFSNFDGIRVSEPMDLEDILYITQECFPKNPKFFNRFKNRKYFTTLQMETYFSSTIVNNFFDSNTITVVYESKKEIVGYYMLKKMNEITYKGILTGVLSRFQKKGIHIAMQKYCFNIIGKPITTINTTQLNNFYTINNHIKEGRKLVDVKHIFYKKN
jgi:hypothetical protein